MIEEQKLRFSIKPAYAFGEAHGLEEEVSGIREMVIEWDSSYTTSLRKGYLVELFDKRGIFTRVPAYCTSLQLCRTRVRLVQWMPRVVQ